LLLVREDGLGQSEFVNVELKYQRTTRTHKQVVDFWRSFRDPEGIALWREFAETMLGRKKRSWKEVDEDVGRGLVIWPSASNPAAPLDSTTRRLNCYRAKGIDTICYSGPASDFKLHAER
jgi:hypothetical protein